MECDVMGHTWVTEDDYLPDTHSYLDLWLGKKWMMYLRVLINSKYEVLDSYFGHSDSYFSVAFSEITLWDSYVW